MDICIDKKIESYGWKTQTFIGTKILKLFRKNVLKYLFKLLQPPNVKHKGFSNFRLLQNFLKYGILFGLTYFIIWTKYRNILTVSCYFLYLFNIRKQSDQSNYHTLINSNEWLWSVAWWVAQFKVCSQRCFNKCYTKQSLQKSWMFRNYFLSKLYFDRCTELLLNLIYMSYITYHTYHSRTK